MASPCIIELPLEAQTSPLGFGLGVPWATEVPICLAPWFGSAKDTHVLEISSLLLDLAQKNSIGGVVSRNNGILATLGTQSHLALVALLCSVSNMSVSETQGDGFLTVRVDPDEWFVVVAPQLAELEGRLADQCDLIKATVLAAACRYLGLTEDFLTG